MVLPDRSLEYSVNSARPIRRIVYVNACIPRPGKPFIEVCQTEQIAVPGSYLDKLLKASKSITDDFLKLINDPDATKAQLKAMQDRIDGILARKGGERHSQVRKAVNEAMSDPSKWEPAKQA